MSTMQEKIKYSVNSAQKLISTDEELIVKLCRWGTSFGLEVIARAYDNHTLPVFLSALHHLYSYIPEEALNLLSRLANDVSELKELLLECRDRTVRENAGKFLIEIIKHLYEPERSRYFLIEQVEIEIKNQKHLIYQSQSPVVRFLDALLSLLPESSKNWPKFSQFLQLFEDFAALGDDEKHVLLDRHAISIFIDFFLQDKSPLFDPTKPRITMGNKSAVAVYAPLVRCVSSLVRVCGETSAFKPVNSFLNDSDRLCLSSESLIYIPLEDNQAPGAIAEIVSSWTRHDESLIDQISQILVNGLYSASSSEVENWFNVIKAWISIDDGFQSDRIEKLFGFDGQQQTTNFSILHAMHEGKFTSPRWCYKCILFLSRLIKSNELVRNFIANIPSYSIDPLQTNWMTRQINQIFAPTAEGLVEHEEIYEAVNNLAKFEMSIYGKTTEAIDRYVRNCLNSMVNIDSSFSQSVIVRVLRGYFPSETGEQQQEEDDEHVVFIVENKFYRNIYFTLAFTSNGLSDNKKMSTNNNDATTTNGKILEIDELAGNYRDDEENAATDNEEIDENDISFFGPINVNNDNSEFQRSYHYEQTNKFPSNVDDSNTNNADNINDTIDNNINNDSDIQSKSEPNENDVPTQPRYNPNFIVPNEQIALEIPFLSACIVYSSPKTDPNAEFNIPVYNWTFELIRESNTNRSRRTNNQNNNNNSYPLIPHGPVSLVEMDDCNAELLEIDN